MSKNTKHKNYKVYLRLSAEEDKLLLAKKNLGYRILDKPIHHGYNAYFTLREDIIKRDDKITHLYQHFINEYASEPWSRTKDFKKKFRKKFRKKGYEIIKPEFRILTEKEYDSYYPWAQEYIQKRSEFHWGVEYHYYVCVIPNYCLVTNIKNSYITKEKIIDGNIECELSFVRDKMQLIRDTSPIYNNNGFANYRRDFTKSDRAYNKIVLNKNITMEYAFDDWEPIDWRDTDWTDWCSSSAWSHDPQEFRYKTRSQAKWMYW
jgi:hypothetical protein